ncbi:hypothetical protein [Baaleninema sp.]|uniref:hypothetical protein n=1 Tax=Baaleninema sp. TaxID=3101197 RepID=UPI003D06EE22
MSWLERSGGGEFCAIAGAIASIEARLFLRMKFNSFAKTARKNGEPHRRFPAGAIVRTDRTVTGFEPVVTE